MNYDNHLNSNFDQLWQNKIKDNIIYFASMYSNLVNTKLKYMRLKLLYSSNFLFSASEILPKIYYYFIKKRHDEVRSSF
jgi:hypothetical protein